MSVKGGKLIWTYVILAIAALLVTWPLTIAPRRRPWLVALAVFSSLVLSFVVGVSVGNRE